MICKKCGKENEKGTKKCVECGEPLTQAKTTSKEVKESNDFVSMLLGGLDNLKNYLLKPSESLKTKKSEDTKSVFITGGILVVVITLVNLIMTMLSSLRSMSMNWSGKISYSIDFANLKDLNYLSLIFKNLFIYAIIILAIAGIFYIGSLIVKKEVKYTKFLTMVYVAAIPLVIGNIVISTILGFIYIPLSIIASIIATVYSIVIFAYLVNSEIQLDNMIKIYYNTACYSIILIIMYFIVAKIISSAINFGNIFGGF